MSISNPEVTIAIVFYNAMPHFRCAIASVLSQTYKDWELLLIDDGSTDGSLEYAKQCADPRIRIFSDGRNLKLNIRLNQSVRAARGKYYFRMDADDVMMPDRVDKQLKVLQMHDDNTVTGTGAVYMDGDGRVTGFRSARKSPQTAYQARHAFIHPSVAAATAWFKNNPYSEDFVFHRSQDAELWVRTFRHSRFVTIPELLMFYRDPGMIKVENYVGTALGLVIIAMRQRSHSRLLALSWAGAELLKCWVTIAMSFYGLTGVLVKRRQNTLPRDLQQKYKQLLSEATARATATSTSSAANAV